MTSRSRSRLWSAFGALALTLAAQVAPATPSARSDVYSAQATNTFCVRAQQIIASTGLASFNVLHNEQTTFVNSAAAPYDGTNLGSYNGTLAWNPTGNTMPLHTQQLISFRELGTTQLMYPVVISCKMKSAEGLNAMFGAGTAGAQKTCADIHRDTVARVYSTLTSVEQRTLKWTQDQIVYPADSMAVAGPNWVYPLPYLPRVAFLGADGKLRLRGYAITVAQNDQSGLVGPDKMGVYYCHVASPDYVRALVTGQQPSPILETPPEI